MSPVFLQLFAQFTCNKNATFFGMPVWYKYLPEKGTDALGQCIFDIEYGNLSTYGLIGFAIMEMLLRAAGLVAVGFVIYGGFQYITSEGEPDKAKTALSTIVNALIGLVITIVAIPVVAFVGARLG